MAVSPKRAATIAFPLREASKIIPIVHLPRRHLFAIFGSAHNHDLLTEMYAHIQCQYLHLHLIA